MNDCSTVTLITLCNALNALTARVNAIDGQGLSSPLIGDIATINGNITGTNNDLQQIVLSFENTLSIFKTAINSTTALVNTLTNTPAGTGIIP